MKTIRPQQVAPGRNIRLPGVCAHGVGSPATVWRRVKDDPTFPKPFKFSPGITVWDENEILDWIESKKAERGAL